MATPSWDSLTPAASTPSWDSLTPVASGGQSAATYPETAQPVKSFESLPTRAEYLKMLPRSRIEDEYIKDKSSGQPINEQEYLDAYRARAREGNLLGDADHTGTAPDVSLWDRTKAAASSLTSGLLTQGNELGKAVLGRDLANNAQPVSNPTRAQAFDNLLQSSQVAALRTAVTVRQMVNNLANKVFRSDKPLISTAHDFEGYSRAVDVRNGMKPVFDSPSAEDDKAYDEQFKANVHAKELEGRLTRGEQVLGSPSSLIHPDPETVTQASNSPLADPTFFVPGLVGAKIADEGITAAKAVNVAEKAAATAPNILRTTVAKPVELAANAVKAANSALDTSPLLRATVAGGAALAVGGEAPIATLSALVGASSPKMNLLQGALSSTESAIRSTADRIAGRLPPGPIGQFAGKTFSALGDQGKALLLTQAANMPFLLGTESEDDFKNMATVGILGHYALGAPLKAVNSLNFAKNFWKSSSDAVAERLPIKDIGTSPVLDQLHRETLTAADNTGNNFVQSMRNYFGKRAELYVLTPEKTVEAIKALKDEGASLPPEIGDNPQAVAAQNGVTSVGLTMPDGTKRNIALATLRDGVPGLGAGHETGHLIEAITSPEELKPVYEAIAQAYGEDGIAKAKKSYENAAAASGQPYQNLSRDNIISELFAENASAVLNSIPIGEFGPEKFEGWRNTARNIYVAVERALNKIGARVPEVDGSGGVKTGLGFDPSAPVGQLIGNLLEAKRIDHATFAPEPEIVSTEKGGVTSPIQSVREVPPEHALPKGLPIEELRVDDTVVAKDGKITALLDPIDGVPQYELTYTDPVDGKRKAGVVSETQLQSRVAPGATAEAAPKSKAGTTFPKSPVTSNTPPGIAMPPATAEEIVAPKHVENTTRPAPEAAPEAKTQEMKPNNVRVTPEQQTNFAQKAAPGVLKENSALLKSVTETTPRKDLPVFETDYYSAKSNVFSPDAIVRKEQRRLADKAEETGKPNPLRAVYQKLFVPYKFVDGATPRVYGFSLDKVIQNVDILKGWALEHGDKSLVVRLDTGFANSVQKYLENQRNGYGGDGTKIKRPVDAREGTITPENPNYTPHKLSVEDKQLINLAMGIEVPQRSSPGSRFAARMAEENGLTPVLDSNGVEITNPLYSQLVKSGFNPKLLNSAVENLPVANFTEPLKARNDLKSAAGDVAITRAGFMPSLHKRNVKEFDSDKVFGSFVMDPHGKLQSVGDITHEGLAARLNGKKEDFDNFSNIEGLRDKGWLRITTDEDTGALRVDGFLRTQPDGSFKKAQPLSKDQRAALESLGIEKEIPIIRDVGTVRNGETSHHEDVIYEPPSGTHFMPSVSEKTNSPEFKKWFGDSKVVDENGKPLIVYHGSNRADRIGARFRKDRATSGPMPYFTDAPEIASNYASGKADTSFEAPSDYAGWFKYKGKGMRSGVQIDQAWWRLSPEERTSITKKLYTTGYENADEGSGPIVGNSSSIMGKESIDYELRQARGNALRALTEIWLNSGSLFGDERQFLDVLKAAGMDMGKVDFDSPNETRAGVFPVHLSIKNPFEVASISPEMMEKLEAASKRKRAKQAAGGTPDAWDKNTISGKEWMDSLRDDMKNGTSHAWTRIPDWVTETLQKEGYDGIKDTGGKLGGSKHAVWVPFEENQIKSAIGNRGTYSADTPDIRFQPATGKEILGAVKNGDEIELHTIPANSEKEHRDFGMRGDRFRFSTGSGTLTWTDLKDEVTPSSRRAAQELLERKGYTVKRQEDWSGHPYSSRGSVNTPMGNKLPILKGSGDKRLSNLKNATR